MDGPLSDSDDDAPVKLASLLVIGLGLAALFVGFEWFWIVFAVGFAVLVPAVKILVGENEAASNPDGVNADSRREPQSDRHGADSPESKRDALDALRNRYAAGELDDAEFERKVERLLETETLEGARDHVARGSERADRPESRPARDADGSQRDRDADESQRDRATER